jgi:hypothetical protein
MRSPPEYIQSAGVLDAPAKFPWDGDGMHFGPSQGTKLHESLAKLTTRVISTVAALCAEWLLWRFHTVIDLDRYLHFIDSTLAWEIDLRYRDAGLAKGIPDNTPANQALGDAMWMLRKVTSDDYWESPTVNVPSTASLVSITKQVLPAKSKAAFLAWLSDAIATATKLDTRPKKKRPAYTDFGGDRDAYHEALQPYFGQPLPREALEPMSGYQVAQRDELLSRFLAGLDWKKNPFLRSPDQMKKLGFKGTPYKL